MNDPLKRMIRHQYHDYIHDLFRNPRSGRPALTAGDHVAVSREKLVDFVDNSYQTINKKNIKKRWIAESFGQCGLNPWLGDEKFCTHLEKLSESGVYAALTAAHEAEILDKIIKHKKSI